MNQDLNDIFKKLCILSKLDFEEAKEILKEDTDYSNSIINGFFLEKSSVKYSKISYEAIIKFLNRLIICEGLEVNDV
jgi:hypothetical protein